MTIGTAATAIRNLVGQDSNSYAAADLVVDINLIYQKAFQVIIESVGDTDFDDSRSQTNYPIATRPLIAGQRDYAFATAAWTLPGLEGASATANTAILPVKIKRVDITYDGTNYNRATAIDSGSVMDSYGNDTTIDQSYASVEPAYDVKYNALWVFPRATAAQVSAGAQMRLEFERTVTDFTSSDLTTGTAVFGFDAPCHSYIVYGTALQRAVSRNLPQVSYLSGLFQDAEAKLRAYYGNKNEDMIMSLAPIIQNYN